MSDMEEKRAFVASISSGRYWKKRVKNMSDSQVIAIYLKEQDRRSQAKKQKQKESGGDDDIPF